MDTNFGENLGKREKSGEGLHSKPSKDEVKKQLKKVDKDFVPKKSDYNPLDNEILDDGEVSSDHSSYNEQNFDKEDFLNFVRRNLAAKQKGKPTHKDAEEEEDEYENEAGDGEEEEDEFDEEGEEEEEADEVEFGLDKPELESPGDEDDEKNSKP